MTDTVWVLGDQLNRAIASLADRTPDNTRILMIESEAKLASERFHRQRLHLVLTAMRRFADELRSEGFAVDYRTSSSFQDGIAAHRQEYSPGAMSVMEPMSWSLLRTLQDLDINVVRSNQFLCHYDEFAAWAGDRGRLVMEDFYRWQRRKLDILMDGDEPAGGAWNYDKANREPPPREPVEWPSPPGSRLDDLDRSVLERLPDTTFGDDPTGVWATSRRAALYRLRHFVDNVLPRYGPHQDAMMSGEWSMAHSLLSPYLNLGLLTPREVCDAAEESYRNGSAPIESVEGFVRQVIGWREYVWGVYWLWMPGYREENRLGAERPLPPLFERGTSEMRCVAQTLVAVEEHGYAHHIQRLMILGNLGLIAGIEPIAMVKWMWASFIDGAEWVMLPNVTGMALHADGGKMATKPYAAGGNYINKMSDYCSDCRFDPSQRTGDDACPFTTLYWDFLRRNETILSQNHRMGRQMAAMRRLSDIDDVAIRAAEVLDALDNGEL